MKRSGSRKNDPASVQTTSVVSHCMKSISALATMSESIKPEQACSNWKNLHRAPRLLWMQPADMGMKLSDDIVDTTIRSRSSAPRPASSSARRAARVPMSEVPSPGRTRCRSRTPVRFITQSCRGMPARWRS
jgi:hypothetical protein